MGEPLKVNRNNYGGSLQNQYVYDQDQDLTLVYTKDGIVTDLQFRPGQGSRPKKQCPTELEIRNARVSANSVTISHAERAEKRAKVREMELCLH